MVGILTRRQHLGFTTAPRLQICSVSGRVFLQGEVKTSTSMQSEENHPHHPTPFPE